jgi:GAF domain-containing protein/HAMP domain-containing protein
MTETQNSQPSKIDFRRRNAPSLRTKLLIGNLLIVLIAVAAMGYFVFYRSQAANEFLVDQFDISVTREIENRLTLITSEEVNDISIFFSSMKNVIETFGTTSGALISTDDTIIPEEAEWNAYQKLKRLPNGSWDNADDESASIFLPASMEISASVAKEITALKGLDYFTHGLLEENPDIIAIYYGGKSGETIYYPNIDLSAVVPPDFDITSRPWYLNATELSRSDIKAVWSVPYQDAALNGLVITGSVPVYDNTGTFRGVAGADLLLSNITDRVNSLSIGRTGYGFLIDAQGRVVTMPSKGYDDFNLTEEEIQSGDIENLSLINRVSLQVFEVLAKMTSGQKGVRLVEINGSNRYIAYKPIPTVGYSLGIVVSEDELLEEFVETNTILETETRQTVFSAVGVIAILLSIAGLAAYGMGNSFTAPLGRLTKVAEEVANGNLDARAEVKSRDEIGVLGKTLNSMTSTAQELVTNLEGVVAERTRAIEKRATQIQAVAEVGQAVAAQRELEELLLRTTHLIGNRFGYYHVGIFLFDARGEYAMLRATNSNGGAQMLARGHKLRVGTEGIVGTVTGSGEARIALDVGEDAAYFDNPDLPQTRSEMALPLIAGGEILGALDIQSVKADAFSQDDVPILQVLADQLATAVQNARMLRDTQEALITARKATGEVSKRGWHTLLQDSEMYGYISQTHGELVQIKDSLDEKTKSDLKISGPIFSEDRRTVTLPIVVRGQTTAMMRLAKPSHIEPWTSDEITDIELLATQISNALESARLFSDAQRRAAQEEAIGEVTAKISATSSIDAILRSTVQELGHRLGDTELVLELETDQDEWEYQRGF